MSRHRYPAGALAGDHVRAGLGITITGAPLPWLTGSPIAFAVLAGLTLAFAVFAVATALRHLTVVELSDVDISTSGPRRVTLRWTDLDRLNLRFFSTRRDRERGWMQLRLGTGKRTVRLESSIDGFDRIVARALAAARANGVSLDRPTRLNLEALGIVAPSDER